MSLVFQERTDGFRVVRMKGEYEKMLASVHAKVMTGYDLKGNAVYVPLPRGECTVTSAIGPLSVADLEEILAGIPNK